MLLFSFHLVPDLFLLDLFVGHSSISKILNVDPWDLDLNLVFFLSFLIDLNYPRAFLSLKNYICNRQSLKKLNTYKNTLRSLRFTPILIHPYVFTPQVSTFISLLFQCFLL